MPTSDSQQKKGYADRFVPPWPLDKPYLNKSGNALLGDFERHFAKYCYKCGFDGHRGPECKTYADSVAILTLCTCCRQGLHDTCRSKRRDLVEKSKVKQLQEGPRDGLRMLGQDQWRPFYPTPYSFPPPFPYPFEMRRSPLDQAHAASAMPGFKQLTTIQED